MNEILTAEQQRLADGFTIRNEPISSIDLMERASVEFVKSIIPYIHGKKTVHVFCGTGNNGGDGLAIARMLREKGCTVHVYLVRYSEMLAADTQINLSRIKDVCIIKDQGDIPVIHHEHVVVDALFGSGLSRPVSGITAEVITAINGSHAFVLSVDVPSGLPCDRIPFEKGAVVRSDYTGTFERPKLSFFLPESSEFVPDWRVIPIGLNQDYIERMENREFYISSGMLSCKVLPRRKFSHKGTYGHGLLIAGSKGKMGAAVLAGKAALRSGAGLLTAHIPGCGYTILQTALPEAMCTVDPDENQVTSVTVGSNYSAIAVGPGIGVGEGSVRVLSSVFQVYDKPMVLDADALNTLALNRDLLNKIPEKSILTPHPGEFERLVGKSDNSLERLELLRAFSQEYNVIVVLKDAVTTIALPGDRIYFNTTGNPGMATAGSGDVLTGVLLGLLAQNYSPEDAALIGVFFHGLAGDAAAAQLGENAVMAGDIAGHLRIHPVS